MPLEEELSEFSPQKDMLLTIGIFDGVHLGHKYLISRLKEEAARQALLCGVVTFRQHPKEVLSPQSELPYLTGLTEKVSLLKKEGVDAVVSLSFTLELARYHPRQFLGLLQKYLRMNGLVVGTDFALGWKREGDVAALGQLGKEMGFTLTVVPPKEMNGMVVSSTAIRRALAEGDMKKVISLTGRAYSLQGQVTTGVGRGAKLGFPTANLEVDSRQAIPAEGVYATRAYLDGKVYQSVTNIGRNPTFGEHRRTVEIYLLNYQGNLYGRQLRIDIVERLRDEKRFDTVEELKKQIAEDVKQGKAILDSQAKK
ncbi:MAG: bifunctional riboflavin kinase/FAD synthetase [Dehalococcoidales bacterium]|nr:bifunctional riboflavin kinase/FAD synthetase [Dehalococcoidales bacterium]